MTKKALEFNFSIAVATLLNAVLSLTKENIRSSEVWNLLDLISHPNCFVKVF